MTIYIMSDCFFCIYVGYIYSLNIYNPGQHCLQGLQYPHRVFFSLLIHTEAESVHFLFLAGILKTPFPNL